MEIALERITCKHDNFINKVFFDKSRLNFHVSYSRHVTYQTVCSLCNLLTDRPAAVLLRGNVFRRWPMSSIKNKRSNAGYVFLYSQGNGLFPVESVR